MMNVLDEDKDGRLSQVCWLAIFPPHSIQFLYSICIQHICFFVQEEFRRAFGDAEREAAIAKVRLKKKKW